ncbi:MAG: S41 family peptidase [Bacteroidota bacterium]
MTIAFSSPRYLLLAFTFFLFACSSDGTGEVVTQQPQPERTISALEQAQIDWLNNMMDVMEANSINRKTIDWSVFRSRVLAEAQGKQTRASLDPVIRTAITLLGDNHSLVRKPAGDFIVGDSNLDCSLQSIPFVDLENVGYVKINGFSGNAQQAQNFAENLQQTIALQDDESLLGWVVDLRNNTGGNMWPMLAGIGPILGEGVVGYFVDPDDMKAEWSYVEGESRLSGQMLSSVSEPYQLLNPDPKVAVLFNRASASSGEAVIVAFEGRPNTRSFGEPSCGISTANVGFDLGDDYALFLTVSTFADREENLYGEGIEPDEAIQDPEALWASVADWFAE